MVAPFATRSMKRSLRTIVTTLIERMSDGTVVATLATRLMKQ